MPSTLLPLFVRVCVKSFGEVFTLAYYVSLKQFNNQVMKYFS